MQSINNTVQDHNAGQNNGTTQNNVGQNLDNTANRIESFDPKADIDLSGIEIVDTAKGEDIGNDILTLNTYSFICSDCEFKYEGRKWMDYCPRCGSKNIDDAI